MRDAQKPEAHEAGTTVDAASDEIARSLGTVWQRFSGQRPESTEVEMGKDAVTCVITETQESAADDGEEPRSDLELSSAGLEYNATAAIVRITGRRVVAFIAKRDKGSQVCTQTFLLDRRRQRF
jgi:hypothetical protein